MSPNNGCLMLFDEMTKDLTPAECDERVEYWKTIVVNGEYSIERTCHTKSESGEGYVTCEIVTDHSSAFAICTNLGPCFTTGDKEPSAGKFAMINRTVTIFARTEAKENSSDSEFSKRMETPQVKQRVNDFRLFTCLVSFCKLAMRRCPWLQPDMSFANLVWKQGDAMINEEYGLPIPEPRRMTRREDNCKTECIMEAVARTYVFKQTAYHSEAGRPTRDKFGKLVQPIQAKLFEITDLWDVLRVCVPSRAVIRDVWTKSLYYSVSTSPSGVNVMTSLCHLANLNVESVLKRIPDQGAKAILHDDGVQAQALEGYMKGRGLDIDELDGLWKEMRTNRRLRMLWRHMANGSSTNSTNVIDNVKAVLDSRGCNKSLKRFVNSLLPTYSMACVHHKPNHLLRWSIGASVDKSEDPIEGCLSYKTVANTSGSSKKYDHAWLLLRSFEGNATTDIKFHSIVAQMRNGGAGSTPAALFDYHHAGIVDTLQLMETSEAARLCPEMPDFEPGAHTSFAFIDECQNRVNANSSKVFVRQSSEPVMLDVRMDVPSLPSSHRPVHESLDKLTAHSRIPALQPYTSSKMTHCSPIRRVKESGIELNAVVAYEHVSMVVESSMLCSNVSGLKNYQERFGCHADARFSSLTYSAQGYYGESPKRVHTLPYSNDLCQIAWTIDLSNRQYIDTMGADLSAFNELVHDQDLGDAIPLSDMPQQPIGCMGYQIKLNVSDSECNLSLSLSIHSTTPNTNKHQHTPSSHHLLHPISSMHSFVQFLTNSMLSIHVLRTLVAFCTFCIAGVWRRKMHSSWRLCSTATHQADTRTKWGDFRLPARLIRRVDTDQTHRRYANGRQKSFGCA